MLGPEIPECSMQCLCSATRLQVRQSAAGVLALCRSQACGAQLRGWSQPETADTNKSFIQ